MNVNQTTCAATDLDFAWEAIDWKKCEAQVKKLQERIVKARKDGRHGKVKSLQWTLTHSFAAKAIAVKRVTTKIGRDRAHLLSGILKCPKCGDTDVHQQTRMDKQRRYLQRDLLLCV